MGTTTRKQPTGSLGSIRVAREDAGISQQDLAVRADCSISFVRLLEQTDYWPAKSDVIPRLLEACGASLSPLAVYRRELGMTQQVLSYRTGMPVERIDRLERGKEQPDRSTEEQLASGLSSLAYCLEILQRPDAYTWTEVN